MWRIVGCVFLFSAWARTLGDLVCFGFARCVLLNCRISKPKIKGLSWDRASDAVQKCHYVGKTYVGSESSRESGTVCVVHSRSVQQANQRQCIVLVRFTRLATFSSSFFLIGANASPGS